MNALGEHAPGEHQERKIALLLLRIRLCQNLHIMIEGIEGIGQRENIGTDFVGRELRPGTLQLILVPGQQGLQLVTALLSDGQNPEIAGMGMDIVLHGCDLCALLLRVLPENGADAHDGIQNIGTGVSLKGGELIKVKDIVLGGLVGEIAVLQRCQTDDSRILLCLSLRHILAPGLPDPLQHLLVGVLDQALETQHAALTGLEGLAILAVHGTEANVVELRLRLHKACLPGHPEELCEVQRLTAVGHIDVTGGLVELFPLQNGAQIRGGIECRTVGFPHHTGRQLLGICGLRDVHHQRALGLIGQSLVDERLDQPRDIGLGIGLALPEIEGHVQCAVILLEIRNADRHDLLPDLPVNRIAALELQCRLVRPLRKFRIHKLTGLVFGLRLVGGCRIDLLQLGNGEVGAETSPVLQLCDDESHLQTPVAEMCVTDHLIAHLPGQTLHALADDRRPQVSHVEGLRHIGTAVVDDDLFTAQGTVQSQVFLPVHAVQVVGEAGRIHAQVNEAGHHCLRLCEERGSLHGCLLQLRHHLIGDVNGLLMVLLGTRHGAVALVFAEVRPVGNADSSQALVIARFAEGLLYRLGNHVLYGFQIDLL